jgi:hypothetical protein
MYVPGPPFRSEQVADHEPVIYIFADFTLALMPIQLIRTLNRPLREKFLVCLLMATGLLTMSMACIKFSTINMPITDPLSDTVYSSMWAKLEEEMAITAACLPVLKGPAERLLTRLGFIGSKPQVPPPSFVSPMHERASSGRQGGSNGSGRDRSAITTQKSDDSLASTIDIDASFGSRPFYGSASS